MTAYVLVDTAEQLIRTASELAGTPRFFLDTEFESTREGTRLCLLQISDGGRVYIIDAVRLPALAALAPVLAAPNAEWVLHSGGQDVPLLVRALEVEEPPRIFDTQVAWAFTSPEYSVSLAYLVYKLLGVRSTKSHQSDDWVKRPLPDRQLAYAADDVTPLPGLYGALRLRLEERQRAEFIHEVSRELCWAEQQAPAVMSLDSFRNAWQLDPKSQAALRFLVDWYNGLGPADREEVPETKVLLAIANRVPETLEDLQRLKGVSRRFLSKQGPTVVRGIAQSIQEASADSFIPIEPASYGSYREILLDAWLGSLRAEVCCGMEIAPELALPARLLKRIRSRLLEGADSDSSLELLESWRGRLLRTALHDWIKQKPFRATDGRS